MAITPLPVRERAKRLRESKKSMYTPTPEEREAFQYVDERWKPSETHKRALEKQWFLNIAFLAGYHYHYWSDYHGGLVYRSDVPRWRIRQPFNKIIEYIETRQSTLMTSRPELRVRPKTAEESDIRAANLGDSLIRHYWQQCEMEFLRHEYTRWFVTTGSAFRKVIWDATSGQNISVPVIDQETQMPALDDLGNPVMEEYREGDIRTEVTSPFQMYLPNASCWDDVEWGIQVTERPIEWVRRHFPEKADYVTPYISGSLDETRHYERTLLNLIGPSGFRHGAGSTPSEGEFVTVKELWSRGDSGMADFPDGRKIIVCGNVVCENENNEYGDLPWEMSQDILVPGRLWGQSIIDHLIPEQRVLNRAIGKFLEVLILHGQPKIRCPVTAGIPDSSLTTEPAERIDYSGNQPPDYLPPPPMAEQAYRFLIETIERQMDHTSVSFSASRGMANQRISGIALAQLIEQDVRDMTPPAQRLAESDRRWGVKVLKLSHEMVDEPRTLRLMGKNKRWEIKEWIGADLRGNKDVYVEPASAMPKNRALALQWAKELVGSGIKNPMDPADRNWLHQLLEIEDTSLGFDTSEIDERYAKMEIESAKKGFPLPMPAWHENHIIHVALHREALQTDSVRGDPIVRQILEQHLQGHMLIMSAMQPRQQGPGGRGKGEEEGEGGGSPEEPDRTANPRGAVPGASPAPAPGGPMRAGLGASVDQMMREGSR